MPLALARQRFNFSAAIDDIVHHTFGQRNAVRPVSDTGFQRHRRDASHVISHRCANSMQRGQSGSLLRQPAAHALEVEPEGDQSGGTD